MNILCADDDKNFGIVLKRELEEDGHRVDLAGDGVEAVLKFTDKKYDFVLIDIRMPMLDGIGAVRVIKAMDPDVPAITYSGSAGSREILESMQAGVVRCLVKPFELAQLKEEIMRYAARQP